MSENILTYLFDEIEDAREKVHKAMEMAHTVRGEVLLDADSLSMARLFKEVEYLSKNVLDD